MWRLERATRPNRGSARTKNPLAGDCSAAASAPSRGRNSPARQLSAPIRQSGRSPGGAFAIWHALEAFVFDRCARVGATLERGKMLNKSLMPVGLCLLAVAVLPACAAETSDPSEPFGNGGT